MAKSKLIVVRHGKTKYTEQGLDLTPQGIAETQATAARLAPELRQYSGHILVDSSPAARALGTASVFLDKTHRSALKGQVRVDPLLRPVDIYNMPEFSTWDRDAATGVYGEAWFTDPNIAESTEYMEGRNPVASRMMAYLEREMQRLTALAERTGLARCVLAFTHFELATNVLRQVYPLDQPFPTAESPGLRQSEDVHVTLDHDDPTGFTIEARGRAQRVQFNSDSKLTPVGGDHGTPDGN